MSPQSTIETFETPEARNERFARGEITEEEIQAYLIKPNQPLFEHTIVRAHNGGEYVSKFTIEALTSDNATDILNAVKRSWEYAPDYEAMKKTFEAYFDQKKIGPSLLNPEYYIARNTSGEVIAVTGIYTTDIMGGAGFATRSKLNTDHYLNARIGWTSVRSDIQGRGLAGYLIDWVESMAKFRGAKHVLAEIDDTPGEEKMRSRYERHGYARGFQINDYFGPGRNLRTYVRDFSDDSVSDVTKLFHQLSTKDSSAITSLASELYSQKRLSEFRECLDLFLKQKIDTGIMIPLSAVMRSELGDIEGYIIATKSIIYPNAIEIHWYGVRKGTNPMLIHEVLRYLCYRHNRSVAIIYSDGEDSDLENLGYEKPVGGIPHIWGDATEQILYSKKC